jgi:hypothetical protein
MKSGTESKELISILKDTSAAKKIVNRVITLVGSTGFPKPSVAKAVEGLSKSPIDNNFLSLAKIMELPIAEYDIDPDEPGDIEYYVDLSKEEIAQKAKEELNVEESADPSVSPVFKKDTIDVDSVVRTQEEKFELLKSKLRNIDIGDRPYIEVNTADRKEDEKGNLTDIKGSSTKGPLAARVVKEIIDQNPEAKSIVIEIYDNNETAIRQMEVPILALEKAGEQTEELPEAQTEMEAIKNLRASLDLSIHDTRIKVKRMQTKTSPDGKITITSLEGKHLTRQKDKSGTSFEGGLLKKFQGIKNAFYKLRNFTIISATGKTGRIPELYKTKFHEALKELGLPLVYDLSMNLSSATQTSGKEEEYSNIENLKQLKTQLEQFLQKYSEFKQNFRSKLPSATKEKPEEPAPAPEAEPTPAAPEQAAPVSAAKPKGRPKKGQAALEEAIVMELKPLLRKLGTALHHTKPYRK